ncbi:hypothetical protein GTQ40_11260 [Flavobacteriaceae bacterium R38]|nr:hypothetical protein [Flavobacteriaceae bacterium R38]
MIFTFRHIVPKQYVALTLWPVIIIKETALKNDPVLLNHERIHLKQQLELFILPFYILYLCEWIVGLYKYRNWYKAYKNISFEREAYLHEENLNYLDNRQKWSFLRYISVKD